MKPLILFLLAASLFSCTKKVDVYHDRDIHDTLYLSSVRVDTFHVFLVRYDTTILHDTHTDTVTQVKHDTLIIRKITFDTLYKNIFDTIYLTKILRDTVTKTVYLHDTVNHTVQVIIRDTILKVVTVQQTDTVYKTSNWLAYPVPAAQGGQLLYIHLDTVPGLVIHSIEFQNIYSWVPSYPLQQNYGSFSQDVSYSVLTDNPYSPYPGDYQLSVPGPMVCNIIIVYDWTVETAVTFDLGTFHSGPGIYSTWETHSPGGLGGAPGTKFTGQTAMFQYINLPNIFQLTIKNHY